MAAEGLALPTGLLTVAVMTRVLGAAGYGQFALAASLTASVQMAIGVIFSRITVKFVAEQDDWRAAGAPILRIHLWVSLLAGLAFFAAAPLWAALLRSPSLETYFRLFAIDLALCIFGQGVRNVLVGAGRLEHRALANALRWLVRMVLIIGAMYGGLGITGAVIGCIGASLTELAVNAFRSRLAFTGGMSLGLTRFLWQGAPLATTAIIFRINDSLDLLLLKALGGTDVQAGLYAMAQNAMRIGGVLTVALWPLLLSAVTYAVRNGRLDDARRSVEDALLTVLAGLALAAPIGAASNEIAALIYGPQTQQVGLLIAILLPTSFGHVWTSLVVATLQAADHTRAALLLGLGLLISTVTVFTLVVPRYGPLGVATATLTLTVLGAIIGGAWLRSEFQVNMPAPTIALCITTYLGLTIAGHHWPAAGAAVLPKLALLATLSLASLLLLPSLRTRSRLLLTSEYARWRAVSAQWLGS